MVLYRLADLVVSLRPLMSIFCELTCRQGFPSLYTPLKSHSLSFTYLCQVSTMDFPYIISVSSYHNPVETSVIIYILWMGKEVRELLRNQS